MKLVIESKLSCIIAETKNCVFSLEIPNGLNLNAHEVVEFYKKTECIKHVKIYGHDEKYNTFAQHFAIKATAEKYGLIYAKKIIK